MDSIKHWENEKFIGRTNFRSGLVDNVVALAATEVAGVAGISKCFSSFKLRPFNKASGVKITYDKDGVVIDVCISIQYGYSAADVSYRVQENVINAAGSMLDKKIKTVNVRITHVHVPHMDEQG